MENSIDEFRSLNIITHLKGLERKKEKGRGSYGAVYEVALENKTSVIAKRLHDIFLEVGYSAKGKQNMIRKFKFECVMLSKLHHPNIVAFLGVHIGPHGENEGDICLVMEALHFDLDKCIDSSIELSYVRKVSILRDVACGLEYLHSKEIGHRDLTSRNVLLTSDLLIAKIADFGCSKLFDSLQEVHTKCPGAADYMPPEAKQENPKYKYELDCFSFGHLSIYLWNRDCPTLDDNSISVEDVETHQRQVGKRRQALSRFQRKHLKLKRFLIKCLSDIPAKRPSSKVIYSFFKNAAGECSFECVSEIKRKPLTTMISIAIGATTLKVAYRIGGGEIIDLPIQEQYRDPSVPTVLLLKNHSDRAELEIGQKAQDQFYNMVVDVTSAVFFKLSKEQLMDFDLSKTITGSNSKEYYLVEVFGAILKKTKENVKDYFSTRYGDAHDFHWVITLWDSKASAMIRVAASLAGFCSETDLASTFSLRPFQASKFDPAIVHSVVSSDKVSIVSRSDTAAVWCSKLPSSATCPPDSCFIVAHIGGQTTAVTAYQITMNCGRAVLLAPPCIRLCGGATVNETFLQYVAECIVYDEHFRSYINHPPDKLNNLQLWALRDEDLEMVKREFSNDDARDFYSVRLPASFLKFYGAHLELSEGDAEVQVVQGSLVLQIRSTKLKQIMDNCLSDIIDCIDSAIVAIEKRVDAIFLVGGFGGCTYVAQKIRSNYNGRIPVETPYKYNMASVHGACLYTSDTPLRISHATYGISCDMSFENNEVDHREESLGSKDRGLFCNQSKFYAIVRKGELIDPFQTHKLKLTPLYYEQSMVMVSLYSTNRDNLIFARDKETGDILEDVTCLASLKAYIPIGIGETSPPLDMEVEFEATEITISLECNKRGRITQTIVY